MSFILWIEEKDNSGHDINYWKPEFFDTEEDMIHFFIYNVPANDNAIMTIKLIRD